MMYTFKCKAAGDVTMTQTDGDRLLHIIGKTPATKGIIEVAAANAAIHALEQQELGVQILRFRVLVHYGDAAPWAVAAAGRPLVRQGR